MSQSDTLDLWSCVGTSNGLAAQSVQRARIGDHDLALWRGVDGIVRAWQNRCPHRGMRLSYGFVRGNRLTCLYHGWTYDGQGSCAAIPAHPNLTPPRTITTQVYDCVEKAGLRWVASKGTSETVPTFDGDWNAVRSLRVDAGAGEIIAALLNPSFHVEVDAMAVFRTAGAAAISPSLDHAVSMAIGESGVPLVCAVQAVGINESMIHITLNGPDAHDPKLRRAVSDWTKLLRGEIERQSVPLAAAA